MKRVPLLAAVAGLSLSLMGSAPPRRVGTMPDDAAILARFAEMVDVDAACAQLAAERGHSKDVRDFGALLVREHATARQMARDVGKQANLSPKPWTDSNRRAEHDKIVKSLRDRPDVAFDVLFIRHEVEYHKELMDLLNKEWIPGAQNADLNGFLQQVAPAFEAHAKMAGELWKQLPH